MKYVQLIMSVSLLCACTNKSLYESIQYYQQQECKKFIAAKPNQYEECMNHHKDSYSEYTRKRINEGE